MSDVLRQSTSRIEHLLEQARLLLQTGHPEAAYQARFDLAVLFE